MILTKNDFEQLQFEPNTYINIAIGSNEDTYPMHWHNACEIIMPLSGTCHILVNNQDYILQAYDLLFINIGELHEMPMASLGDRMILQFDFSLISSLSDFSNDLTHLRSIRTITPNSPSGIHNIVKDWMLEIRKLSIEGMAFKSALMYANLLKIYATIAHNSYGIEHQFPDLTRSKQQEYLQKFKLATTYIHNHYGQTITLEEVAQSAGFSKFHFSRLFCQFSGKSFSDYVNDYRITKAEVQLLNVSKTVTEVALECGFSSLSTFNRTFKQKKGVRPSDFRNMYHGH